MFSGPANAPVLLLEGGVPLMSACWGWIAPALAARVRVIAYDRAGLGWSGERPGLRDATQIAEELDALLQKICPGERVILAGHSMGALFNRTFLARNRASVLAMIWLDPAHPRQMRIRELRARMKKFLHSIESASLLAFKNLPLQQFPLMQQLNGLPGADRHAMEFFLKSAPHLRTAAREARAFEISAEQAGAVLLGTLPLLVISAQKHALPGWPELQSDLAALSPIAKHVTFTDASHLSLLANQEHALRAAGEIGAFLDEMRL
jgi:pimeloyl-ACP methyl ester carboxylesterase